MRNNIFLIWVKRIFLGLSIPFCFFVLIFAKTRSINAAIELQLTPPHQVVIEHLRLKVSKDMKEEWLMAEKLTWEPWLLKQKGFVGRKIYWDPKREEATLLITWESKKKWKEISESEIQSIQNKFEKVASNQMGRELVNPFPLIFEGELFEQ